MLLLCTIFLFCFLTLSWLYLIFLIIWSITSFVYEICGVGRKYNLVEISIWKIWTVNINRYRHNRICTYIYNLTTVQSAVVHNQEIIFRLQYFKLMKYSLSIVFMNTSCTTGSTFKYSKLVRSVMDPITQEEKDEVTAISFTPC